MSLGTGSKDHWSERERYTIRERCKFMFNNELLSDVKFVVPDPEGGSESMKTIPAHKLVLAISSPVFYAMFFGELAETTNSINSSDCEYPSLLELFRFIYSDEVNLNADNVMQVLYLAKKYMLPSLADQCTDFLGKNLDASNVFHVLPEAQTYEEKNLVDKCWEVIDEHGDEAMKSDAFTTIEKSLLEELVERESLNVTEVELFKAVDCWARRECEKKNLAVEGSVKRKILGERVVANIRFPVMEQKEFAEVVLDCEILTPKEAYDIMKYFNGVLPNPVGFLETKRSGRNSRISMYTALRFGLKDPAGHGDLFSRDHMRLSVNETIELRAVRLFGSENNEYKVSLEVADINYHFLASMTDIFTSMPMQSDMGYYHGIRVIFNPSLTLQADTKYFFNATLEGPPTWYGEDAVSYIEHDDLTISFFNDLSGGPFAELEYRLK